jgi:hypothetical protein
MHIANKYLSPELLAEARKRRLPFFGFLRRLPISTQSCSHFHDSSSNSKNSLNFRKKVIFLEPAPSTAALVSADSSSEEEDVLQV